MAIRLPDPAAVVAAVRGAWEDGQAVLVLDPASPDTTAEALLRRLRPAALVHLRPDGQQRVTRLPGGVPVADGTAAVVATSGSTGAPRGIVLSHDAMVASAAASVARLGCAGGDRWLLCLPLHHVAGLAVLQRSRVLGTEPETLPRFTVDGVARSGARWWPLVPTMVARLLDADTDMKGRGILLGGAVADDDLVAAARTAGATVTVGYGMTETCGGCVYDGRPLDGVTVEVATGGRIRLRGPVVADGARLPDGSVVPVVDPDGWLTTGDTGHWEDGRLVVDGRADAVIITGGENVSPDAVEAILATHPDVADVGVLGLPHPDWGHAVVAVIVPADPASPPDLGDLRDLVGARLGRHAAPRELRIATAIPRTSLGKVARADLAHLASLTDRALPD